jgi:hypothetical protein
VHLLVLFTRNCAGIFGWSYNFQLNRSVKSKWQFLSCASTALSERYGHMRGLYVFHKSLQLVTVSAVVRQSRPVA